jgi:hypothetical protein
MRLLLVGSDESPESSQTSADLRRDSKCRKMRALCGWALAA